ncbi:hypothetical protein E8E14_004496 [Neopestalotiopsis sp. 37M]|nr:hypothetical protein E8E14_004496 [Neopestalotiopsis sp. 37M]
MALLQPQHLAIIGITAVILHLLTTAQRSGLRRIPGPFLAKVTDLWRLFDHWRGTHVETQRALHEKYGPAVRIGPNAVSLSDPALLKTVYSTRGEFAKSDHYSVTDGSAHGQRVSTIFSTRSHAFHTQKTAPIAKLYSLPSMLRMEHLADRALTTLCSHLDDQFVEGENAGRSFDMADWINFYVWDHSFQLAFSKSAEFMETGTDVDGILQSSERMHRYITVIGQLPFLDLLLGRNPYFPFKLVTLQSVVNRCVGLIMERVKSPEAMLDKTDMLDGFLEAKKLHPEAVNDGDVIGYAVVIVSNPKKVCIKKIVEVDEFVLRKFVGGADTSASVEKAIIYHLLKNRDILAKLQAELDTANLSFPAQYKEVEALEYLGAVIHEGLRILPPVGVILERVVPSSGLELPDGRTIPAGTIVGMNAWITSRNKEIFGDDVETFRPERWLQAEGEDEDAFKSRVTAMKEASFSWGGGNRVCMGKNMATVSISKAIATIFSRYDLELVDPAKDWELLQLWFVIPKGILVRASRRK